MGVETDHLGVGVGLGQHHGGGAMAAPDVGDAGGPRAQPAVEAVEGRDPGLGEIGRVGGPE